jgi:hypothetical protein
MKNEMEVTMESVEFVMGAASTLLANVTFIPKDSSVVQSIIIPVSHERGRELLDEMDERKTYRVEIGKKVA